MHGCIKLFAEVDINGDGGMDWSEFMQYMIDAVRGTGEKQRKKDEVESGPTTVEVCGRALKKIKDMTVKFANYSNSCKMSNELGKNMVLLGKLKVPDELEGCIQAFGFDKNRNTVCLLSKD